MRQQCFVLCMFRPFWAVTEFWEGVGDERLKKPQREF